MIGQTYRQYQLLPDLTEDEYEALKADIAARGVMVPVEYDEAGNILDGHHRVRACAELGLSSWPRIVRVGMTKQEKMAHVVALNLDRRHLDESQRAMVAARMANMPSHRPSESRSIDLLSQSQAAEVVNVSVPSLKRAKVVLDKGTPELIGAVEQGEIAVSQAAQIARMEPEAQAAIVGKVINDGAKPHVAKNSGDNEWYTPAEYIEAARAVMGAIDLDPASTETANSVVQSATYYTAEQDGLCQPWYGRVWMNPPYAQPMIGQFCERLAASLPNIEQAIVLVNNATETRWFGTLASLASAICFPSGRVKFWAPDKVAAPLQGQAVVYIGANVDRFADAFRKFGFITYTEAGS